MNDKSHVLDWDISNFSISTHMHIFLFSTSIKQLFFFFKLNDAVDVFFETDRALAEEKQFRLITPRQHAFRYTNVSCQEVYRNAMTCWYVSFISLLFVCRKSERKKEKEKEIVQFTALFSTLSLMNHFFFFKLFSTSNILLPLSLRRNVLFFLDELFHFRRDISCIDHLSLHRSNCKDFVSFQTA